MEIESFAQVRVCDTEAELREFLRERCRFSANGFFFELQTFPRLDIFINGNIAHAHFVPLEDHPGLSAVGGGCATGMATFYLDNAYQKFEITDDQVISVDMGYEIRVEFWRSREMWGGVEWYEL